MDMNACLARSPSRFLGGLLIPLCGLLTTACITPIPIDDDASGETPTGTEGDSSDGGMGGSGHIPGCNSSASSSGGSTSGSSTTGSSTSGAATGGPTTTGTTANGEDGPLITTGNDSAVEWDVTVRHTPNGGPPVEDTYYSTTLLDDTDFEGFVAIPSGGGGTSYAWIYGDAVGSAVTITEGGVATFEVIIEGMLDVTDSTLEGSGTYHDEMSHDLLGTWEILSATPL